MARTSCARCSVKCSNKPEKEGARRTLSKPFRRDQLLEAVGACLAEDEAYTKEQNASPALEAERRVDRIDPDLGDRIAAFHDQQRRPAEFALVRIRRTSSTAGVQARPRSTTLAFLRSQPCFGHSL